MADSGKVSYGVSMTPITRIDTVDNQSGAHDVINTDIGKSLGGSADVACSAGHTTVGYSGGTVAYDEAEVSGGSNSTLGSAGYDFVFIKHTGKKYVSGALGTASTGNLVVTLGSQVVCTIPPNGAVTLPNVPAANIIVKSSSASDNIAVEYALIT